MTYYIHDWGTLSDDARLAVLERPKGLQDPAIETAVKEILAHVKRDGDTAIRRLTSKFDRADITNPLIPEDELETAAQNLPQNERRALEVAIANIDAFHTAQIPQPIRVETMPGVVCQRLPRPLGRVGLYVPAGSAPLVSTVLMLAIPAKIAGVKSVAMMCPPQPDGTINKKVLAAAFMCGVTEVYAIGGAQAIAAMAYGTETISAVNKVFGPGNAYVAVAKQTVAQEMGGPAIDLPAGPSEVMVVADRQARPDFVASDLLSQAEHDSLAQVVLVADKSFNYSSLESELELQIERLPRKAIAQASLENMRIVRFNNLSQCIDIINYYAAEHLILQISNAEDLLPSIESAGSVFVGPWTPESLGDYASGTNHVLPTYGSAKAYSGVTLESFMTYMSVQEVSRDGLSVLGPYVETLAEMEELHAHKNAVSIRLQSGDIS